MAVSVTFLEDPKAAALLDENTAEQLSASPTFRDLVSLAALKAAQNSQTVAETLHLDPELAHKIALPVAKILDHKVRTQRDVQE